MLIELLLIVFTWVAPTDRLSAEAQTEESARESAEVRSARAEVQLAEVNLKRVRQMNQRFARTVPASVVAEYQQDLEIAKLQLQVATAGGADEFDVWLRRAEGEWKTAEMYWKNTAAVNRSAQGTAGSIEVERLRLRAEVAKLALERGRELSKAGREEQVQWQIELLNSELQRVREDARLKAPDTNWYPLWRY